MVLEKNSPGSFPFLCGLHDRCNTAHLVPSRSHSCHLLPSPAPPLFVTGRLHVQCLWSF